MGATMNIPDAAIEAAKWAVYRAWTHMPHSNTEANCEMFARAAIEAATPEIEQVLRQSITQEILVRGDP